MNDPEQQSIQKIIDHLVEAWNAHDASRVSTFYSPDYVGQDIAITRQQHGQEGVRAAVQHYLNAFPDLAIRVEETLISGGRAAVKVQVRGTQRGTILNIPATGCLVEVPGVAFLTVQNEKIQQASYLWDVACFLRGIGLLPDL